MERSWQKHHNATVTYDYFRPQAISSAARLDRTEILAPRFDRLPSLIQTHDTVDIQAFITESAVNFLNIGFVNPIEKRRRIMLRFLPMNSGRLANVIFADSMHRSANEDFGRMMVG